MPKLYICIILIFGCVLISCQKEQKVLIEKDKVPQQTVEQEPEQKASETQALEKQEIRNKQVPETDVATSEFESLFAEMQQELDMDESEVMQSTLELTKEPDVDFTQWKSELEEAKQLAAQYRRLILIFFSGLNYSKYCKVLKSRVFDSGAFEDFAKERLVLLHADFPIPNKQSEKIQQQNESLKVTHKVHTFPAVVVITPDGKYSKQVNPYEIDPEEFIKDLKKEIDKK